MLKKVCNIFTICKCTVFVPKVCCICPLILDYANIVYNIQNYKSVEFLHWLTIDLSEASCFTC